MNLNEMFLPYQQKWLLDRSPLRLYLKSRRIGISWTSAYGCVDDGMMHAGLDINIFSRDEDLAADMIGYMKPWVKGLNAVADEDYIVDGAVRAYQILFPNASRIRSWSSAPDRAVGKSGICLADEFQSHPDAERLMSYMLPTRLWGGQISIVGTMRRPSLFADLCDDAKTANVGGWSYHETFLEEALSQGLLDKVNEVRRAKGWAAHANEAEFKRDLFKGMTEEMVRQEYYGESMEKVYRVFPDEVIKRQSIDPTVILQPSSKKRGLCYLGYDVGRIHDHAVLAIIEQFQGKQYTRLLKSLVNTPFVEQRAAIKAAIEEWSPERIVIDTSTIGIELGEWALSSWGEFRVIPVTITGMAKEKVIVHAQTKMDSGELFIPDTPALAKQFKSITKRLTVENFVRYTLPTTAAGHCDEALAVCLACWGTSGNPGEVMAERLKKVEPKGKRPYDGKRHPAEEE